MKLKGVASEKFAVVCTEEDQSVITAKQELIYYLDKISGCDNEAHEKSHVIYIGSNYPEARIDIAKLLSPEGFVIKFYGEDLVITGKTSVAALYGTYYFIEKYLGTEWLTPDCEIFVKDVSNVDIIPDEIYDFTARMRICHCNFAYNEKFRARQRLTYTVGDTNDKAAYGGIRGLKFAFYWGYFGHTFEVLLPYEKYYANHPDWYSFSDRYFGENHRYQICLTNKDVLKTVTENALLYLDEHSDCKIISISQNDSYGDFYHNYCTCENCTKIWKKDGNYSAVLLNFVNAVAREIGKKYTDVLVHTFAYNFTEDPPNTIKPEKNVVVQFCLQLPYGVSIDDETDVAKRELAKAEKWHGLTNKLFAWTYICNHSDYLAPVGNFCSLYKNTVYFLRGRAIGLFQQERMDYYCCEFSELRTYLTAKLFSNPYMSYKKYREYMSIFAKGFYGKGGSYIISYIDLLQQKFNGVNLVKMSENEKLHFYGDAEFIAKGKRLFDAAERFSRNKIELERVKKCRMQLEFCETVAAYIGKKSEYPEKRRAFIEKLLSFGVKNYREGAAIPPINKIDCTKSPFIFSQNDKIIKLKNGTLQSERAGESTVDIYGFDFTFSVKYSDGTLNVKINVTDREIYCRDSNIDSWEQDCVEIYISEHFNRTAQLSDGDYKIRVNAHGKCGFFGNGQKVKSCVTELTEDGYFVNVEFYTSCPKKIGFEIVAHDFNEIGVYVGTRYWNALKFADVFSAPYHYGIIEIEE